MKIAFGTLITTLFISNLALAWTVVPTCKDSGIGIEDLRAPISENSVTEYNGQVVIYNTENPVPNCGRGLAVVMPDVHSQAGDSICYYLGCFASVDITLNQEPEHRSYSGTTGLQIEIQPSVYSQSLGYPVAGRTFKMRINMADSTVKTDRPIP